MVTRKSWGSIEKTVEIMMHVKKHNIGPAFWTVQTSVLMMIPRAFLEQACKNLRKIGLKNTALSIESADRHWVRICHAMGRYR